MWLYILFVLGCCSGFALFHRNLIPRREDADEDGGRLSVIIPARNEEKNLPFILDSLLAQTRKPWEIIVVDDGSEDRTAEIARSYGVTLVANPPLPPGWTGKTWAVWNGYLHSAGDTLAFLDTDLRLEPRALELLLAARSRSGGVVSVVPYHYTEKLYERLALVFNVLGVFAFTSPFERINPQQGLYGSCIVTSRQDYEAVNGHESIRSEVMDDLSLGKRYREAGLPVTNYLGAGLISFRMYPNGINSEIQGFGKSAVLGTAKLSARTVSLVALWFIGLVVSSGALFLWFTPWEVPLLAGYLLYTLQLYYWLRDVGGFGRLMPLLHVFSTLFVLLVMLYSAYQVMFLGHVSWKGRNIQVGGKR